MRNPKIIVSECLHGTKCRYDGQGYNDKVILSLKDYVDIQTVCPEVSIGLPTPREPIRIEKASEGGYIISGQFVYGSGHDKMILTQFCAKRSVEIKNK